MYEGPGYLEIEGVSIDLKNARAREVGGFKPVDVATKTGRSRGGVETNKRWEISFSVVLPKGVYVDFGSLRDVTVAIQPVSSGGVTHVFPNSNISDFEIAVESQSETEYSGVVHTGDHETLT